MAPVSKCIFHSRPPAFGWCECFGESSKQWIWSRSYLFPAEYSMCSASLGDSIGFRAFKSRWFFQRPALALKIREPTKCSKEVSEMENQGRSGNQTQGGLGAKQISTKNVYCKTKRAFGQLLSFRCTLPRWPFQSWLEVSVLLFTGHLYLWALHRPHTLQAWLPEARPSRLPEYIITQAEVS